MRARLLRAAGELWVIVATVVLLGSALVHLPFLPPGVRALLEVWHHFAPRNVVLAAAGILLIAPGVGAILVAEWLAPQPRSRPGRRLLPLRLWMGPGRRDRGMHTREAEREDR